MIAFLAQLDPNLLSLTGVIATILSVIFALGAFYNSRTRKKHLMELERQQRQEQALHFRPAKSHHPGRSGMASRSSLPSRSSKPEKTPAPGKSSTPVAKQSSRDLPVESKKAKTSAKPILFRQVRPDGVKADVAAKEEEAEVYVWE